MLATAVIVNSYILQKGERKDRSLFYDIGYKWFQFS
jgi:hypothetical protein